MVVGSASCAKVGQRDAGVAEASDGAVVDVGVDDVGVESESCHGVTSRIRCQRRVAACRASRRMASISAVMQPPVAEHGASLHVVVGQRGRAPGRKRVARQGVCGRIDGPAGIEDLTHEGIAREHPRVEDVGRVAVCGAHLAQGGALVEHV